MGRSKPEKTQQEQKSTVAPPSWTQPHYETAARDLGDVYRRSAPAVYTGQRVAPLSAGTQGAISALSALPAQYQNQAFMNQLTSPTYAQQNLAGLASGAETGMGGAFNRALQAALSNVSTNVNEAMSGAGRYGSGAHTGVLGQTMGDIAAQATADQYNRDVANRLAANQMIDAARMGQMGMAQNWLQAQGQAGIQALAANQLRDQYQQAVLNAQRQQWQEQQEAPWLRQARMTQAITGLTGRFGDTTANLYGQRDPGNNPYANWTNLLGMGLMAAGTAAGGYLGGPAGAAAGASAGKKLSSLISGQ